MAKRLTRMGLLTALALIIFTIEAQIPPLVPIPGVKLGLANIITVYSMFCLGPKDTFKILVCRIILGSIFVGNMIVLLYSLSGGLLCFLIMIPVHKIVTKNQIWVCSVLGAIAHNIGQITVAIALTRTLSLLYYLPVLLISGIIAGLFTGLCAQYTVQRLPYVNDH